MEGQQQHGSITDACMYCNTGIDMATVYEGVPPHTQQPRLLRDCTIPLCCCALLPAAVKTAQNKAVLQRKMGETA